MSACVCVCQCACVCVLLRDRESVCVYVCVCACVRIHQVEVARHGLFEGPCMASNDVDEKQGAHSLFSNGSTVDPTFWCQKQREQIHSPATKHIVCRCTLESSNTFSTH
mmetsp:Transcript_46433/g.68207  ORF Transcript_46433/g.68207 Transcript_46433/m.68207 type:complete len:109 (+) Transcript_46433:1652-1978(+)